MNIDEMIKMLESMKSEGVTTISILESATGEINNDFSLDYDEADDSENPTNAYIMI